MCKALSHLNYGTVGQIDIEIFGGEKNAIIVVDGAVYVAPYDSVEDVEDLARVLHDQPTAVYTQVINMLKAMI